MAGTWAFSGETVLDVGSAASQTATFTPATGSGNYNTLTKEIVPTITQATYGDQTANGSAKYGAAGTVDLTSLIVEGGTAAYLSHTNTNNALDGAPSVSGKTLNFRFVDNAALATKIEEIIVKVTSNNYADYTITVTVTVESKTTPTVTITVTPDKGYTLETLTVTDNYGKKVEVTAKDGKYTFRMPGSKVAVKATFMDDNNMLNFFVDVPADAYYYDAVLWAVKEGVTNGTSATTFSPDNPCTRAQMVTFLYRYYVK